MRILCTNDWHFAKTNPASRKDDYNEELFSLLDQLAKAVAVLKVDALCVAGDIFHNKGASTWDTVVRLMDWGQRIRRSCRLLCVAGNHDEQHDRYESIGNTPYGVLTGSGIFEDISRRTVTVSGVAFYGVPWPDGGTPDVFKQIPEHVSVVLAHGFATVDGEEQWNTYCHKYSDLALQAPQVRLWHFGHDHSDHGVFKLANGAQVVNIGALSRGALDYDSIIRQVKTAVAEIHPGSLDVKQFVLQQKPADQIFDLDRHRERVQEQQHLNAFLDQLQTGLSQVLDVDYRQVLASMALDANVRERVESYISRAEAVQ
jgi:DNA repair exonuclease SbcCD nuclease subunit